MNQEQPQAPAEPVNDWKEAVIDACVVGEIGWDENDPRKSLQQLITWETQIALDPLVSSCAQSLVDKGRAEIFAALADDGDKDLAAQLRAATCNSMHPLMSKAVARIERVMKLEAMLAEHAAAEAAKQQADDNFPFS